MENSVSRTENPLYYEKVGKLIARYAIPSIISGLISAFYNIVDQIFIGQSIGILGNAATNVSFPIVTLCTGLCLLIGIGSASNFSLECGRGNKEKAMHIVANGLVLFVIIGLSLCAIVLLFLEPLLHLFGATEDNLPYALSYAGITAIGIPFLIFGTGGSHIIRADGSPKYAMLSISTGAILNCFLDPLFIFGFGMDMQGAALATIIGQIVSSIIVFIYMTRFKTRRFERKDFKLEGSIFKIIISIGMASCINQMAMMIVQIALNNVLRVYGSMSIYGSDIPLACVGVISKVNVILISIIIGISQGCQPILGFNYGAKNYARVKETYKKAIKIGLCVSVVAFLCFQLFPRQIVAIFGSGSELYFRFAERYFRIYMMMTIINCLQPLTSTLFSSLGKAKLGIVMSLTRQVIFLLPLIVLLPIFFGIDGVMYAGPISDTAAATLAVILATHEIRKMDIIAKVD